MLKRLLPFGLIILVYESFRSLADQLNGYVNYTLPPAIDNWLFGSLPTITLQDWWWKGHVSWYDFLFYLAYMQHFILPFGLALIIWKTRESHYWRFVTTYVSLSFAAFLTYVAFPAAPPWLAAEHNYIQPVSRISSDVWAALGLQDFPSFYNQITPNIVAAVPSLHAAWATLFVLFVFRLYGKRWGLLATLYPLLIYVGTVYQGEHYVFDALVGAIYALVAFKATPYLITKIRQQASRLSRKKLGNP